MSLEVILTLKIWPNRESAMNRFDDLQNQVLSLPAAERGRLAVVVLDSVADEPVD